MPKWDTLPPSLFSVEKSEMESPGTPGAQTTAVVVQSVVDYSGGPLQHEVSAACAVFGTPEGPLEQEWSQRFGQEAKRGTPGSQAEAQICSPGPNEPFLSTSQVQESKLPSNLDLFVAGGVSQSAKSLIPTQPPMGPPLPKSRSMKQCSVNDSQKLQKMTLLGPPVQFGKSWSRSIFEQLGNFGFSVG